MAFTLTASPGTTPTLSKAARTLTSAEIDAVRRGQAPANPLAAWDFAADARGYSYGAAAELYFDDWSARIGRFATPEHPNQLRMDFRVHEFYGDQLEIEHVTARARPL